MPDESLPNVLSVEEAANYLRVSVKTVRSNIKTGTIPAVRLGKEYRILREHVENLLQTGNAHGEPKEDN